MKSICTTTPEKLGKNIFWAWAAAAAAGSATSVSVFDALVAELVVLLSLLLIR